MRGLVAGAVLLTVTGCGPVSTVCPAIAWGSSIRVELTGDWTGRSVGQVELECSPSCPRLTVLDEVTGDQVPLDEAADPLIWSVQFGSEQPRSAVATVYAADGTELVRVESPLEFRRVGGSEECGGPMLATVRVPAP